MPASAGVLQLFEALGQGGGLGAGQALALIARALGSLAEVMQVLFPVLAGLEHAFDVAFDGAEQMVHGDLLLCGRLQAGEYRFGVARELGKLLLDRSEELTLSALAILSNLLAEFGLGFVEGGGGLGGGAHRVVLVLEELLLDVAVADPAGDAAELVQAALELLGGWLPGGEAGDHGEEGELGLDAAGGGAQLVDGF